MVQVGGLYLVLHYVTMLVLAALTLLSHMNQFCCGSCAIYAWPVGTSLNLASLWLTPIPHSLMYLPDHQHPVYLVGSWYIRLGYSFRLFNFWRHIMTLSICLWTHHYQHWQSRQTRITGFSLVVLALHFVEQSIYFSGTSCRFNSWLAISTQQMDVVLRTTWHQP